MKEGFITIETVQLPSSFDSLVEVESLVDRVCTQLGIQEEVFGNVLIAVTEAVNNAIQHGNVFSNELKVIVGVGNSSDEFCFKVDDCGKGFDFSVLPDPTSPDNILLENGRGIFLMQNLADEVVFESPGNSVILYFKK
ncbi:MAG: hypothetical protein RL264_1629 [Bacteroidota bacterium]|jgi:serine/threonine-protein kinase RsbW